MTAPASIIDSPRAWVAAVGALVAYAMGFGTVYSFGAFFDTMAEEFDAGRGATAILFGVALLAFFGFGVVSGPLSDRLGPRPVVGAGLVLMVGGLLATAEANSLWVGCITYGIGVGIGAGCFAAPLTAMVGSLFDVKRSAALGVTAVGSGLGTLLIVPLAQRWIDDWGWRDAFRGLAVVVAIGLGVAFLAVAAPPKQQGDGAEGVPASDFLADARFRSIWIASFLVSVSLFIAFGFVKPFATDNGIASDSAARLIAIIGLSSIVGRLGLTQAADRLGPLRLFQVVILIQPIGYLFWVFGGSTYWALVVFAVVLGVTYGGFVAIMPAVGIDLFGLKGVGRMMGLLFMSFGIGGLIGPPGAGYLSEWVDGQVPVKLIALGLVVLAGFVSLGISRSHEVVGSTSPA